eukprot:CAMPEP_0172560772 /NCGR_PEP_ID=MMETSP1067-20121228/90135_1 /TAXON_ID=265564 ORGANISM="Thalassiosira punctigera, Strain Tpunct2005C2" /NCGR_SAMPLE_ID=MMETSP1067 /ASSEMBLY_ACC=CAM_ASM_000444 /LENGTH=114 /DNA_ID=CAMNT_0013350641 /DNA_START=218 /DNA_END=562 /DNA_ORIENTATION=-
MVILAISHAWFLGPATFGTAVLPDGRVASEGARVSVRAERGANAATPPRPRPCVRLCPILFPHRGRDQRDVVPREFAECSPLSACLVGRPPHPRSPMFQGAQLEGQFSTQPLPR